MKKRNALGIISLTLVFFMSLAGCQQPVADPLSSDATLQNVRVAGVEPVSLGEPSEDWEQVVPGVVYLAAGQMADAAIEADASSGAYVYLDKKAVGEEPVNFVEAGGNLKFTFQHGELLFVELFSANHDKYIIYAVQIRKRTPLLSNIALNGVFAKSLGTPAETAAEAVAGEAYFDQAQADKFLPISVAAEIENTEFRVGTGATPVFDSALYVKAENNGFIYLESKSGEEPGDTLYYKLQLKSSLSPSSIGTGTVTIGNQAVSFGAAGATFAAAGYAAAGQLATFDRASLSNVAVVLNPSPPSGLTVRYGWSKATGTAPDNWGPSLGAVHSGAYVGIEVTNPDLGSVVYYKFRVMATSANTTAAISAATIDGAAATPGTEGTAWNNPATNIVDVEVNGLPKNITVAATPADNASIRYGTTTAAATTPANWSVNGSFTSVAPGTIIGVEVVSENGATTRYYRFRVKGVGLSGEAAITSITVNNITVTAAASGTAWAATLASAPIVVPNLSTTLMVSVGGLSSGATVEYGYSTAAATAPAWREAGAFPSAVVGSFIGVRVTAQDKVTVNIYRVRFVTGTSNSSAITHIKIGDTQYEVGTPNVGAGVWGSTTSWFNPYVATPDITVPNLPRDITVTVVGADPSATVRYGFASIKSTTNNDRPNLDRTKLGNDTEGVTFAGFENGWFICVEVVSPDMSSISTYGFHAISGPSTDSAITSVNIGGQAVTGTDIPTPSVYISGNTGNPWVGWTATLATTDVALTGLPKDITVNVPTAAIPAGARVLYGSSAANNQQPNNWNTHGQLTNVTAGMFVGVQVISENANKAFYRFRITSGTDTGTTLNGNVTINGQSVTPGASGATWNAALATVNVTPASFSNITVTAAAGSGATVTYGTSSANATAPALWVSSGSFSNVAPGTFVGVRVVAANGVNVALYRFRLVNGAGNTAAITSATIGEKGVTPGTAGTAFNASLAATPVTLNRAALLNPLVVSAAGSGKLTIRYGTSAATGTAPTNWTAIGSFSNVATGTFIGVEVTSEDFSTVRFYKFQVTLE